MSIEDKFGHSLKSGLKNSATGRQGFTFWKWSDNKIQNWIL